MVAWRALAGRPTGAIGHRHEGRVQRRQALDGVPQGALHLLGLRREELEGDIWRRLRVMAVGGGGLYLGHRDSTNSESGTGRRASSLAARLPQR